jgi:hypothetical protein
MHTYNEDEIIGLMTRYGWGFGERFVFNQIVVSFTRRDWHGHPMNRPVTVTRFGAPEQREELIRRAGREAWRLWRNFPDSPPAQYFDIQTMSIVWKTHPILPEIHSGIASSASVGYSSV